MTEQNENTTVETDETTEAAATAVERRKAVPPADFIRAYAPLQRAGKTRAEIAKAMGYSLPNFSTKLSNTGLELYIATCQFKTSDGKVVPGHEYVVTFRDVLREKYMAEAESADYSEETDPVAAKVDAIDKAGKLTTLEASRQLRNLVDEGEVVPVNMDSDDNAPIVLPNPVGGRSKRDFGDIADMTRELFG